MPMYDICQEVETVMFTSGKSPQIAPLTNGIWFITSSIALAVTSRLVSWSSCSADGLTAV